MNQYNTRIAPSPTGLLHIGTARTAYFNWLAARATGGSFLLRIDDTDKARSTQENIDAIFGAMSWLGLDFDKTFKQSDRLERYHQVVQSLINDGNALRLNDGAIQLCVNWDLASKIWSDKLSGEIKISDQDISVIDKLIIMRGDETPTYNFATVVDDIDFNINLIIRGVDHIGNTIKQCQIFDMLCGINNRPEFCHVGLLFKDKKKLSKRDPDGFGSIESLKDRGLDPDAVLDFMLRLGWGPKGEDKTHSVISKERAVNLFIASGNMRNSQANVDIAKLESFDRKYKARKIRADNA